MTDREQMAREVLAEQFGWDADAVRHARGIAITPAEVVAAMLTFADRERAPVQVDVKWRERWYGSDPQKGSAIVDESGNLIAYLGGDEATHKAATAIAAAHNAALTPSLQTGGEVTALSYAERLCFEKRILAVEMQLMAARRALEPFATKACGWEQNHPWHGNRDSVQVAHRLGDFRDARDTLTKIDAFLKEDRTHEG